MAKKCAACEKAKMQKMAKGGSLKPVDASKNPGLSKLPTPVRNKMGYQKTGGVTKMQKGGTSVDSSAYFSKKFDDAYEALKSGKVSKKQGLSDMKKATEGSNRQLVKRGLKK